MSTVVPMNVEKNGGSSSSSSSSNCAKILAGVLFLSTVGLAIVLGVVLASDDDNDSLTSASVASETIYKEFGELQTWKQLGGSYNNTNYLPASAPLAPAAGGTLEAFKVVLLKQYEGAAGTFRGLVDETHFYQLVTDDAATAHWDTLPMGAGDIGPRVLKFNRFSGALEAASDTITIPTHAYDKDGSLVALDSPAVDPETGEETRFELPQWTSRGPLAMSEDAIFVPHTTGNLLMKLSKSDLKPVWTFKAPHWLSIGEMQRQSGDEVNSGAYGDSPSYRLNQVMYHENVNMPDGSTKNIVTVQTSAGTAYTSLVHGLRGFPDLLGEDGLNTPNVRYDAKWGWGTAYLFGLEDLGNSVKLAWETSPTPPELEVNGEPLPDDAFPDSGEQWILTQFPDGLDNYTFSDGDETSGVPKTSGRILIPYQWKTAITGTIAEPGNRTVLVDGVEQQANVIHSVGEIDLPPGATLSETVTVESIHSLETGELILQSGNLLREHLVGVPMPMKVFRNTPRSEEVCFGLAYFGGTMYGTASYNEQTQILSVGTSNGYKAPLGDIVKIQSQTPENFTDHNDVTHIITGAVYGNESGASFLRLQPYDRSNTDALGTMAWNDDVEKVKETLMDLAVAAFQSGDHDEAFAYRRDIDRLEIASHTAKNTEQEYFTSLPQRAQRNHVGMLMQVDIATGNITNVQCATFPDFQRDNAGTNAISHRTSYTHVYHEMGMNLDVMSVADDGANIVVQKKNWIEVFPQNGSESILHNPIEGSLATFSSMVVKDGITYQLISGNTDINTNTSKLQLLPIVPVDGPVTSTKEGDLAIPDPLFTTTSRVSFLVAMDLEKDSDGNSNYHWIRPVASGRDGGELWSRTDWFGTSYAHGISAMVGGVVGYGMSLYIGNHVGSIEVVDMLTGELIRDMPTTAGTSAGMPIVNWAGYHIGGSTHWGRIRQKAQLMEMFTPYGK